MKKNLILAALIAAATGAHAQSSVTLFGIVDTGYTRGSGSLTGKSQVTSGNNNSSRIGFRGVEDLGGGMSAAFWLEAQLNTDTGAGGVTNTNNQNTPAVGNGGITFGRRSTVSLIAPWGEIRAGRDFTSHYLNRSAADVFAVVGVGASQPHVGTLGGPVATRASNLIGYYLPPKLGGFYGQAQIYLGENNSGTTPATTAIEDDGRGYSVRGGYQAGGLNLSAAFGNTSYAAGDIKSTSLLAAYDAKIVRLSAAYLRDRNEAPANFTGRGYTVGALVPVGVNEVKVSLSRYGSDAGLKPTTRKLALGYVHNLSKRTALYATWARVNNSGGASVALGGSTTAANTGSSGYDLGIRHNF